MIYLATVYRKHPGGLEAAYVMACRATALLWGQGHEIYSPIAHSHGVAVFGGIDPMGYEIFRRHNGEMMDLCHEIWVLKTEGWDQSEGIADEISYFRAQGKDIRYIDGQALGL